MNANKVLMLLVLLAFSLGGCASMQPMSQYARTGDTVMVSLGGTENNALVPVLKKKNMSVTITDAANNVYPVTVRSVFRVYADPTGAYAGRSPYAKGYPYETYAQPNQGLWMAVIDLVDPSTGDAPTLAVGSAKLTVSSPEITQWVDTSGYGWTWPNGNLGDIPITILDGTGSLNPMNYETPISYAPLTALEPDPQIEVRPSGTPSTTIGGAFFVFKYVMSDFHPANSSSNDPHIRAVTTSDDQNVQLSSMIVPQGDGTALLKVMITNPHGFATTNNKNQLAVGESLFRSLRVEVAWDKLLTNITDSNWQDSLQLQSAVFVDINGNTMPELTASVTKVN